MDMPLLIGEIVIIVLLVVLLAAVLLRRSGGNTAALEKELALLREQLDSLTRQMRDDEARRSETELTRLGNVQRNITALQESHQKRTENALANMHGSMETFRQKTDGQVKEINAIVTEKMQKILDRKLNEAFDTVVKNMTELGKNLSEGQARQQTAVKEEIGALRKEMTDSLGSIRTENTAALDKLRTENQASLDKIDRTVNEKLQKTLNDRITQSFETVNQRLKEVYEGLGEMKNVASGVSDLKKVLANVKNRGIMGEVQLAAILEDILAPEQYEAQYRLAPGVSEMVDFAVKLPGRQEGEAVWLPIDSKFPGERYAALVDAYETGDAAAVRERRAALEQEIKRCARSIHDKYILPPHTTDFAILFLPFEGLYAEVVNMGLVEVLQREYKVNLTGPSTMAAMLNSLQMGFRTLAIQKKSGEVWKILGAAKAEFANFEAVLLKTRDRLRKADEELDKLVGVRTRAINRSLKDITVLDAAEGGELPTLPEA